MKNAKDMTDAEYTEALKLAEQGKLVPPSRAVDDNRTTSDDQSASVNNTSNTTTTPPPPRDNFHPRNAMNMSETEYKVAVRAIERGEYRFA